MKFLFGFALAIAAVATVAVLMQKRPTSARKALESAVSAPRANITPQGMAFKAKWAKMSRRQRDLLSQEVEKELAGVDVSEYPMDVYDGIFLAVAARIMGIGPGAS